jgi:hypothetical protein
MSRHRPGAIAAAAAFVLMVVGSGGELAPAPGRKQGDTDAGNDSWFGALFGGGGRVEDAAEAGERASARGAPPMVVVDGQW